LQETRYFLAFLALARPREKNFSFDVNVLQAARLDVAARQFYTAEDAEEDGDALMRPHFCDDRVLACEEAAADHDGIAGSKPTLLGKDDDAVSLTTA
jgi:hypothetical protein